MIEATFSIENLIEIVKNGGSVRTGVDVYNKKGTLLLARDVLVDKIRPLEIIRDNGIRSVPVTPKGGLWDGTGTQIRVAADGGLKLPGHARQNTGKVVHRIREIQEIRRQALLKYDRAKACLKKAVDQVRQTRGQFDIQAVEKKVADMVDFSAETSHPFAYVGRELFFYDDYMYQHAANVCAMGTAVLHRFNTHFSRAVETALWENRELAGPSGFSYYYPDDLKEISFGLFIFDIGKGMVPESLLNKTGQLTQDELGTVRRHSYEFGLRVLERNQLNTPALRSMVQYHHGPLFDGEPGCYPDDRAWSDLPVHVRICKLADIYDAMTSKRSYKDAVNQVSALTGLFRTYVKKDPMLQYILHAFVKTVGRYPPGSIVYLRNGQMAYVLESEGPLVLPFTDTREKTLAAKPDPMDVSGQDDLFQVDPDRVIKSPRDVYERLPNYIKQIAMPT